MGILYVISTPIGNRDDITLRALKILPKLDCLLCEDTRKTGQLLKFYQLKSPRLESFYEPVEEQKLGEVITWLKTGKNIGLVSNSGTPLISDPGFKLVRECIRQKIAITALPGPSAVLAALVTSGLPTDKFVFLGFLPKKESKKIKLLTSLNYTTIAYESPFRLIKTLRLIDQLLPKNQVVICRELTKKFEESFRGTAKEILIQMSGQAVKGETVILISTITA